MSIHRFRFWQGKPLKSKSFYFQSHNTHIRISELCHICLPSIHPSYLQFSFYLSFSISPVEKESKHSLNLFFLSIPFIQIPSHPSHTKEKSALEMQQRKKHRSYYILGPKITPDKCLESGRMKTLERPPQKC